MDTSVVWIQAALFLGSLLLASVSSVVLASCIDRSSARLHLSQGLAGLLTALGANSPEISTAVVAVLSKNHDLGLGVILGSNVFNLAALLGGSALVAGSLRVSRGVVALNGTVATLFSLVALMLVLKISGPWPSLLILTLAFVPYVTLLTLTPKAIERLESRGRLIRLLCEVVRATHHEARKDKDPRQAQGADALAIIPALASTVLGSIGMVNSATTLGQHWSLSPNIIGILILASLTGVPNLLAAIRLSLHGRGPAVISEALNSNSLNIGFGFLLPILVLGEGQVSSLTEFSAYWFLGTSLLSTVLLFWLKGMGRKSAACLIGLYLVFGMIVCKW